jgi:acetoacetate decarboxylase
MPPRYGKLNVASWAKSAAPIDGYGTQPWVLKAAQVLEFRHEIDDQPADALLPPALHPAMPAYATFAVTRFPESPLGPFAVGEIRVVGRAGGRPLAFVLKTYCDNEAARRELATRSGYPVAPAEIDLTLLHYEIAGRVVAQGHTVLELRLADRRPLPGTHLQPLPSATLAHTRDGKLTLVQVDIETVFTQSEGGNGATLGFDSDAFGTQESLKPINLMSAAFATVDLTLSRIQQIYDPERPAETGATFVGE